MDGWTIKLRHRGCIDKPTIPGGLRRVLIWTYNYFTLLLRYIMLTDFISFREKLTCTYAQKLRCRNHLALVWIMISAINLLATKRDWVSDPLHISNIHKISSNLSCSTDVRRDISFIAFRIIWLGNVLHSHLIPKGALVLSNVTRSGRNFVMPLQGRHPGDCWLPCFLTHVC